MATSWLVITLRQEKLPPKIVITIAKFLARFFPKLKIPGTDLYSTFDEAFGDQRWAQAGSSNPFVQEASLTPPLLDMAVTTLAASKSNDKLMDLVEVALFFLVGGGDISIFPTAKSLSKSPSQKISDWKA